MLQTETQSAEERVPDKALQILIIMSPCVIRRSVVANILGCALHDKLISGRSNDVS